MDPCTKETTMCAGQKMARQGPTALGALCLGVVVLATLRAYRVGCKHPELIGARP